MNTELIVALDVDSRPKALKLVRQLYPTVKIFKVGLQLYTACGPEIIKDIKIIGAEVFLDLKFNDIPNTMVSAVKEAIKLKVDLLTVHTLSGPTALKEVAQTAKGSKTKILGVTILTSLCPSCLKGLGINRTIEQEVVALAKMAKRNGLSGIVCSPKEAKMVRQALGKNFLIVTPGIRPAGSARGDQHRIATPQQAIQNGANYLVIGRPITACPHPLQAAEAISQEIQ
jgi:orotidine-5'-phosphate decarboxylase